MRVIGVDGCRGGWICVALEDRAVRPEGPGAGRERGHWVSRDFADVMVRATDADLVLVDIPIGLLEGGPGPRGPDAEARRLLQGKRASSVFPAPARPVLRARDYATANALSRELTGKGLSKQSWMIAPKIREVDELLRTRPELVGRVREVHPEVCFHAFAGGRSMAHNKKTADGFAERFRLLAARHPRAEPILGSILLWQGRSASRDDAVDALVAALTAAVLVAEPAALRTLPPEPARDAHGIPMEMVYAGGTASNPSIADWNCVS
jgi:predicted RNase H-like nuclease